MVYTKGPKQVAIDALARRQFYVKAKPFVPLLSLAQAANEIVAALSLHDGTTGDGTTIEPIDDAEFVEVERDGVKTGIAAAKRESVSGLSKAINGLEAAEKRHVHIVAKGKAGGKRLPTHPQTPGDGVALKSAKYDPIFANLKAKIDAVPAVSPKAEAKRIAKGGEPGKLIGLRLQPDLLARLDAERGEEGRQEYIKALLEDTLPRLMP
jgi:hypothetical protein